MSNTGEGLAWLGFWLMLGLWNINIDIHTKQSDTDLAIEQFLKGGKND